MAPRNRPSENSDFSNSVIEQLGGIDDDDENENEGIDEEEEEVEDDAGEDDDDGGSEEDQEEDEGEEADEDGEQDDSESDPDFKLKSDKDGNLIDPRTKKIIAPRGAARRFYEKLQATTSQNRALLNEVNKRGQMIQQAREALIALNAKNEAMTKQATELGMTPENQLEAMAIMSRFNNDATAIDALRYLLTKAAQRGIDIKSLGAGSGAVDPKSLSETITKQVGDILKPFTERQQIEQRREQLTNEIKSEIVEFVGANPAAKPYLGYLGKIIENPQFSHLSLNEAWLYFQNYLLRNPDAFSRGAGNGQQRQRPRPSGRSRPDANSGDRRDFVEDEPMDADLEFSDIINSVIADHGPITG